MNLISVLILSLQYSHDSTSGCVFIGSFRHETHGSGRVIYVNHLQWHTFLSPCRRVFWILLGVPGTNVKGELTHRQVVLLFVSHSVLLQICFSLFASFVLRHLCPVHEVGAFHSFPASYLYITNLIKLHD